MTRRAVLICPGRGTYNKTELGYLARHHKGDQTGHSGGHSLLAEFDALRQEAGQESVTSLDGAARFSVAKYTRGDVASPLIYASSLLDARDVADDIEVVAVTGNSMGWYSALAVAGAVTPEGGFTIVNTMGTLMQDHMAGGQIVYPHVAQDWRPAPKAKADLLALVAGIGARAGHVLALSIDLGGLLVVAGNDAGLAAFEAAVPPVDRRFPLRLANHAAFHTDLQAPVSQIAQGRLSPDLFAQPTTPLVDGRGAIWWPHASNTDALQRYTLGAQVTQTYDFTRAVSVAAREFAPDLFIIAGPGDTLGGAVIQSLISCGWRGMADRSDFETLQADRPFVVSMGRDDQRAMVTTGNENV